MRLSHRSTLRRLSPACALALLILNACGSSGGGATPTLERGCDLHRGVSHAIGAAGLAACPDSIAGRHIADSVARLTATIVWNANCLPGQGPNP